MPIAVGIYLPLTVSTPILFGGLLRWVVNKASGRDDDAGLGVLLCSGLIAGESLMGVILGFVRLTMDSRGAQLPDEVTQALPADLHEPLALILLVSIMVWIFVASKLRRGDG